MKNKKHDEWCLSKIMGPQYSGESSLNTRVNTGNCQKIKTQWNFFIMFSRGNVTKTFVQSNKIGNVVVCALENTF